MAGVRLVGSRTESVPPPESDDVLVARAQANSVAFAPLYDRYVDPIYRYCRYRLDDAVDAEDATALVFVRALAALPRFRLGDGSFRSWLFAIAHNTVANRYRGTRDERPLDEALHLVARDPAPEAAALAAERRRELAAALAGLTRDQRRVIELRLAGLSGAEIAVALGRSPAAVKMLQLRAVDRLQALLNVGGDRQEDRHVPR